MRRFILGVLFGAAISAAASELYDMTLAERVARLERCVVDLSEAPCKPRGFASSPVDTLRFMMQPTWQGRDGVYWDCSGQTGWW